MAANSPPSPSPSQLPPIPASPTYSYASTANPLSQYNLPPPPPPRPSHAVLTKADLANSQAAYSDLLASAKAYRLALASLSTAASSFGAALESCARLKEARAELTTPPPGGSGGGSGHNGGGNITGGPPPPAAAININMSNSFIAPQSTCTADALLTTAGLHLLIANHQHILSETVYRAFEVPLLHDLDKWRAGVDDEEESYTRAVETQSKEIRRLERDGVKMMNRQRRRDVGQLRNHLVELTGKLDGLTVLHGEHARTLLRESQEASGRIVDASCSLVRAEVDIFESLARKGWTGGGLEDVLERGVDLFAAEMEDHTGGLGSDGKGVTGADGGGGSAGFGVAGGDGTKLFSILPPKSILADTNSGSDTARGGGGTAGKETRSDSLLVGDSDRYQSLANAVSRGRDRDADSVFSTTEFNRSRNVRPFSPQPQPLKLNPMDLLGGIEDEVAEPASSTSALRKDGGARRDHEDIAEVDEDCAVEDGHQDRAKGNVNKGGDEESEEDDDEDEEDDEDDEDDDEDEDDDDHPWRNEGLRRGSSDHGEEDKVGTSPGGTQQRKGTWSDTTDGQ